jgi:hypothetical protein
VEGRRSRIEDGCVGMKRDGKHFCFVGSRRGRELREEGICLFVLLAGCVSQMLMQMLMMGV